MASITREIVTGMFDLLKQWWVWATLVVGVGFATGTLTQRTFFIILDKAANIF
jgi:hypothetical protein